MKQKLIKTSSDLVFSAENYAKNLKNLPEQTERSVISQARSLDKWLNSKGYSFPDLNEELLNDFLSEVKNASQYSTHNARIWAIKKLLGSLPEFQTEMAQKRLKNLFSRHKSIYKDQIIDKDEYITKEELEILVKNCLNGSKSDAKTGVLIQSLFESACRINGLINIKLEDVTEEDNHYKIEVLEKGSKIRTVYIQKETYEKVIELYQPKKYLFESRLGGKLGQPNVYKSIKRLSSKHIGKEISPHTLRHSWVMDALARGLNIKFISSYLGHKSPAITLEMYVHTKPTAEEALNIN